MTELGTEHASKLFSRMDDEEIKEISHRISNLGALTRDTVKQLFVEFAEQLTSVGTLVGSYDTVERLLANTLPGERVENIMEEIRGPAPDAPCGTSWATSTSPSSPTT
jgi:flagellar motor switch protein FliG